MLILLGKGLYHYFKGSVHRLGRTGCRLNWDFCWLSVPHIHEEMHISSHAVKNVSLWPFLWHYYPLFVPFRNVTLAQTWKQHCCASMEPLFVRNCWKASLKMTLSAGKCWTAGGFFESDHLSVAQIQLTEDKTLPGCSNMQLSAGGRFD